MIAPALPRPDWSLWVTAAALAVAAHAGAFGLLQGQLPDPPAAPVETEIIVDSIRMASGGNKIATDAATPVETLSADVTRPETATSVPAGSSPEAASPAPPADRIVGQIAQTNATATAPTRLTAQTADNSEPAQAARSALPRPAPSNSVASTSSAEAVAPSAQLELVAPSAPEGLAAPSAERDSVEALAETDFVTPSANTVPVAPSAQLGLVTPSAEVDLVAPSAEVGLVAPSAQSQRIVGQPLAPEAPIETQPTADAARIASAPLVSQRVVGQPALSAAVSDMPTPVATAIESGSIAEKGAEIGAITGAEIARAAPQAAPTPTNTPAALSVRPETPSATAVASARITAQAPAPQSVIAQPTAPVASVGAVDGAPETIAALPEEDVPEPDPAPLPSVETVTSVPEEPAQNQLSPAVVEALAELLAEAEDLKTADEEPPQDEVIALASPVPQDMVPQRLAPSVTAPSTVQPTVLGPQASTDGAQASGSGSATPAPSGDVSAQDRARYAAILDFLKTYDGGGCFAALPALGEETGNLSLDAFGETSKRLDGFKSGLDQTAGIVPNTYLKPVSSAQCATLQFIKRSNRYPAFGIYFDLAEREIPSGDLLQGQIFNTGGLVLHLLLIDDEGTVQSLDSFVKFRRVAAEFSIPMTFQGGPIVTQQLLMAVGSPSRLATIKEMNGAAAEAFFAALEDEQASKGLSLDLSMVAFSVR